MRNTERDERTEPDITDAMKAAYHGDDYPEFDMDGGLYHPHPSPEDLAEHEAYQNWSAEQMAKGLCGGCGGPGPFVCNCNCADYCADCMNAYHTAHGGR